MLINPFTPSEIAAAPDLFFGRHNELAAADTALRKGSLLIQGGVGIGKSSLLAQVRMRAEGFCSTSNGHTVCVVGHKDILSVEDAARLVLDAFVEVDEESNSFKLKFGGVAEYESKEVVRNFAEGRHCATLLKLLSKQYIGATAGQDGFLVIAVDEVDKCPISIARLVRVVSTHVQQEHVANVRFILAGVNPYYKLMLAEDEGMQRFFYKKIHLQPMPEHEAQELFEAKLADVLDDAKKRDVNVEVNRAVVFLAVSLSGGHPHVLQLLGSHTIDRENLCSDGVIDRNDMVEALRVICYEDRGYVYDRLISSLKLNGFTSAFHRLLEMADDPFPTRIPADKAANESPATLEWLLDNNILLVVNDREYGLVDEFLRIRMTLDSLGENPRDVARQILSSSSSFYPVTKEAKKDDRDYYEEVVRDFTKSQFRGPGNQ